MTHLPKYSPNLELADIMFFINSYNRFDVSENVTVARVIIKIYILSHKRTPTFLLQLSALDSGTTCLQLTFHSRVVEFLWMQFILHVYSDSPCTFHFKCPCNKYNKYHNTPV